MAAVDADREGLRSKLFRMTQDNQALELRLKMYKSICTAQQLYQVLKCSCVKLPL